MTNRGVDRAGLASSNNQMSQLGGPVRLLGGSCGLTGLPLQLTVGLG